MNILFILHIICKSYSLNNIIVLYNNNFYIHYLYFIMLRL